MPRPILPACWEWSARQRSDRKCFSKLTRLAGGYRENRVGSSSVARSEEDIAHDLRLHGDNDNSRRFESGAPGSAWRALLLNQFDVLGGGAGS